MATLSDRMKEYERSFDHYLPPRLPVLARLDGMAFHTLTRKAQRPFDEAFISLMVRTARHLCEMTPTVELAFVQSDEISLLFYYYKKLESQPWFGNRASKIISFLSGQASAYFNTKVWDDQWLENPATFDCRLWVMPEIDVSNYFIWRWKDWVRNSVQMAARSVYSHKELNGKKQADMHEMLHQKGINWNNYNSYLKNGSIVVKKSPFLPMIEEGNKREWKVDGAPETMENWRKLIEYILYREEN